MCYFSRFILHNNKKSQNSIGDHCVETDRILKLFAMVL